MEIIPAGFPCDEMDSEEKLQRYNSTRRNILALIAGETDEIAVLATVAAELYQAFPHFHWVGFYRVVSSGLLKVGPYQGGDVQPQDRRSGVGSLDLKHRGALMKESLLP